MKEIPLTQGKTALVDDCDFEELSKNRWHAVKCSGKWYASRKVRLENGGRRCLYMHAQLMPGVSEIDHKDGNGLNNSRSENLRPATHSQNMANRQIQRNNTSGFRGVCRSLSRWRAYIVKDRARKYIGSFSTPEEGARAYDKVAKEFFGQFAQLNFSQDA